MKKNELKKIYVVEFIGIDGEILGLCPQAFFSKEDAEKRASQQNNMTVVQLYMGDDDESNQ